MCESLLDNRVKHILGETVMILVKAKVYRVVFPLSRKCYILEEFPVDICTRLINHAVGAALPSHERTAGTCRIGRGCTADLSDYVLWLEQNRRWGQARWSVICAAVGVIIYAVGVGLIIESPINLWGVWVMNTVVVIIWAVLKMRKRIITCILYSIGILCKSGNLIIITVNSVAVGVALGLCCCSDNSRTGIAVIVCSKRSMSDMCCLYRTGQTYKSLFFCFKICLCVANCSCIAQRITKNSSCRIQCILVIVPWFCCIPACLTSVTNAGIIVWTEGSFIYNCCVEIEVVICWHSTGLIC